LRKSDIRPAAAAPRVRPRGIALRRSRLARKIIGAARATGRHRMAMARRTSPCRFAAVALAALLALAPAVGRATATAQAVALSAAAGCSSADLDISLTTVGATREFGLATDLSGQTLYTFEQATTLGTFSGTYAGYVIGPLSPPAIAGSVVGSYAYVGATPPTSATTAEFFVLYNCSTRKVLLSCYGPYGTCPQTAKQGYATIAIPTLSPAALALAALLLAAAGVRTLARRA
jgi:hypothetical protein